MLLAVDAGNTNVVFAVFEGEAMRGHWRASTQARRTADEHLIFLQAWLQAAGIAAQQLTGAIISSVVPEATFDLKMLCEQHLKLKTIVVGENNTKLELKIKLDRPEEVGADRLVNAFAGKHLFNLPLLIIDFGTATTIDVVDQAGDYCGGIIAPGAQLSLQALHMAAAKLPRVAIAKPERVIGTGTISAMQSGVFWGYVGMIEGLVSRIAQELAHKPTVVATGGLAPLFAGATEVIDKIDQELTLRGLHLIYARNQR